MVIIGWGMNGQISYWLVKIVMGKVPKAFVFEDFIEGQLPHVEYTFVYINILNNFDQLILTHVEPTFQAEIKTAFQTFIRTIFP